MSDEIIKVWVNSMGSLAGDIDDAAHELMLLQGAKATQELRASRDSRVVEVTRELVEVTEFMDKAEELVKEHDIDGQLDGYEVEEVVDVTLEVEEQGHIGVRVTEEEQ